MILTLAAEVDALKLEGGLSLELLQIALEHGEAFAQAVEELGRRPDRFDASRDLFRTFGHGAAPTAPTTKPSGHSTLDFMIRNLGRRGPPKTPRRPPPGTNDPSTSR